ncbi:MAG: Trk system potassium transporter TrkA [Actinomycetia bacterium]|nr:Trk system potassium transporter TrkA [Actinomycetes bacterium]
MKILLIGGGQVGATVADALHDEHDITVIDTDPANLSALSSRYDVASVEGNGASRRVLQQAGIGDADLVIAGTSRDEINIIASMFARRLSPGKTIVRVANVEYLEAWHERQFDVDFMVSSEVEAAYAVSRHIGVPAARQTDIFADGQVQIVEFDVPEGVRDHAVVGVPLRDAKIPSESKVAGIIRGETLTVPRGGDAIASGDRVVVIGSPGAARAWSRLFSHMSRAVDDVVIYGAGNTGLAIADVLQAQHIRVRIVEASPERARYVAEALPHVRVLNATGTDAEFIERERIGQARAAVFAMRDDAKNLYAAMLAKMHGVPFTIAIVHEAVSLSVLEKAGIDVAINPREVTAEEIVRFAHDPRVLQLAMLEGDRYEVLDITVRGDSELVGTPFRDLPMTGSLIGAIVRDGKAIIPRGDDVLLPGDRAIIFSESSRIPLVERVL